MDNKTKMGIGALLLTTSLGVGVGRLTAAPPTPEVRLVSVTVDPVVALTVVVAGKPKRIQCSDADGPVVKLGGKEFTKAKELCDAATKFATGAKASVGLLASDLAK